MGEYTVKLWEVIRTASSGLLVRYAFLFGIIDYYTCYTVNAIVRITRLQQLYILENFSNLHISSRSQQG